MNMIEKAKEFATEAHSGQFRRDGVTPYIKHPKAVAERLAGESENLIAAAWLHDVVEDCGVSYDELSYEFNSEVADLVWCVSKLDRETYRERINYIKVCGEDAVKLKTADILSNLSDAPTKKQIVKYAKALLWLHAE